MKSRRAGQRVFASLKRFLERRLKLRINEEKSAVDYAWRRKILGFSFTWERKPRIRRASQTVKRFKQRIRWLTQRSRSINMAERLARLNEDLKGWMGYFRLIKTPAHCRPWTNG